MTTFTLLNQEKREVQFSKKIKSCVSVYDYVSNNKKISICFHPTIPFGMCALDVNELDNKEINIVLDKFMEMGVQQHEFKGGFDEAIKNLSI